MQQRIHAAAATGYGVAADVYDRSRPAYPPAAVDWLVEHVGGDVVEIGAGTGRLTLALAARGVRVVAVEPVAAMRERLTGAVAGVEVIDATAEDLPFAAATIRGIVAASRCTGPTPTAH